MMRALAGLSFVVTLMAVTLVSADDKTSSAELKTVLKAIQPVIKDLDPAVEVEHEGSRSLLITYKTQKFKIHGVAKSGDVSPETHDEVGPSVKGFVLRVHLQPKGEVNQAVTPQTLKRPYWLTDLDVTTVGKTDHQIYWGLSYGAQTDKKLLDELRAKLRSVEK